MSEEQVKGWGVYGYAIKLLDDRLVPSPDWTAKPKRIASEVRSHWRRNYTVHRPRASLREICRNGMNYYYWRDIGGAAGHAPVTASLDHIVWVR